MPEYRLYCLDGGGHISLAEPVEALDDAAAIVEACRVHRGGLKCEVWRGDKLIATLDARDLAN